LQRRQPLLYKEREREKEDENRGIVQGKIMMVGPTQLLPKVLRWMAENQPVPSSVVVSSWMY
jgi:hypothetical protein